MPDDYSGHRPTLDSPAEDAAAVTTSDVTNFAKTCKALYIGGAGPETGNLGCGAADRRLHCR